MIVDSLSVFFPAFNEEKNLPKTVANAISVLSKLSLKWEVLIIDDGSKDQTGKIADDLAKKHKQVRVIHQPNGGYGKALIAGFYGSKYDWIAFTDSDGQFDFSEITKFLDKADNADLVVGFRMDRQDKLVRKINGHLWNLLCNILLGLGVKDVDCAFKLIKKQVFEQIPHLESTRGAMISPELLAKARKHHFRIVQIGVHHYPRREGNPTGANLNVILQSFKDLFKLWWKIR